MFVSSYDDNLVTNALGSPRLKGSLRLIRLYRFSYIKTYRTPFRDSIPDSALCCGQIRDANRVERGLYVCNSCATTMNADVNGAVNIRRKITQTPPTGDMSNGCLAQPGVYLFDTTTGAFHPQEQADCKP